MDNFKIKLKNFIELTRGYSLGITLASCIVIFSYAYYSENFSFIKFFILVFALCSLHLGANLFDDYIDIKQKQKTTPNLCDITFSSLVPKARLILDGTYSEKQVKLIIACLFAIASLAGIFFAITSGWQILIYMLIGGLLTLFYPISAKYYLAEVIIGLIFGPLMITGGYFALTQSFNSNLLMLSWAIFFACLVLLHAHSLMDWEHDIKEKKNTLCILLKNKQNAMYALKAFIIASYFIIALGVFFTNFNPKMLYVFLTLPIATKLLESMNDYINIKDIKFEPRWYWGIFENWQTIKERKIDFFMFRFYLARNFTFFFALFASIGAMI